MTRVVDDEETPQDSADGDDVKEMGQEPTQVEMRRPMFVLAFGNTAEEDGEFEALLKRALPKARTS